MYEECCSFSTFHLRSAFSQSEKALVRWKVLHSFSLICPFSLCKRHLLGVRSIVHYGLSYQIITPHWKITICYGNCMVNHKITNKNCDHFSVGFLCLLLCVICFDYVYASVVCVCVVRLYMYVYIVGVCVCLINM